jgi:hypothetical protein
LRLQFKTNVVEITSVGWSPDGHTSAVSHAQVQQMGLPVHTYIIWSRDD